MGHLQDLPSSIRDRPILSSKILQEAAVLSLLPAPFTPFSLLDGDDSGKSRRMYRQASRERRAHQSTGRGGEVEAASLATSQRRLYLFHAPSLGHTVAASAASRCPSGCVQLHCKERRGRCLSPVSRR